MFDPEPYAKGIRELNRAEQALLLSRLENARSEATRLSHLIRKADPTVRSVMLFGSVASGNPKTPDFDIDLALEGGDIYSAMDITDTSPFKIDLVSLDHLPPAVRDGILEKGLRL